MTMMLKGSIEEVYQEADTTSLQQVIPQVITGEPLNLQEIQRTPAVPEPSDAPNIPQCSWPPSLLYLLSKFPEDIPLQNKNLLSIKRHPIIQTLIPFER